MKYFRDQVVIFLTFFIVIYGLVGCSDSDGRAYGTASGGGGLGVHNTSTGEIQLLDLHEAYWDRGWRFPEFESLQSALNFALERIGRLPVASPITRAAVEAEILQIQNNTDYEEDPSFSDWQQTLLLDYKTLFSMGPPDENQLELVRLAQYDDDLNRLTLAKPFWDQMSYINQAALLIHESVYHLLRKELKLEDARAVRKLIPNFFVTGSASENELGDIYPTIPNRPPLGEFRAPPVTPPNALKCVSSRPVDPSPDQPSGNSDQEASSEFYVYTTSNGYLVVDFKMLSGMQCMSDCVAEYPLNEEQQAELPIDVLGEIKNVHVVTETNGYWALEIKSIDGQKITFDLVEGGGGLYSIKTLVPTSAICSTIK